LLDYFGPTASLSNPEAQFVLITMGNLRECLFVAPPLSSPHKDDWRIENLTPLVADPDCGQTLASLMTMRVKGDVSNTTTYLMSSATLVVLLKKDAETMAEMKRTHGDEYLQPQRTLGMGSTLIKVTSNCALSLLKGNLGRNVGPA
jgi:hypothetical protein